MGEKQKKSGGAPRREKTREQILEAAYRALVKIGYERITTRRIAEEAGCNVAALHYYFGDKETLLTEAVRAIQQEDSARIRSSIAAAPSGAIALESAFNTVWEIVRERPGIVRYDLIVRGLRSETTRREALLLYGAFRQLTEEILQRHLNEGGVLPPELTITDLAHYLISSVDGVILQFALTQNETITQTSLDLILRNALSLMGNTLTSPTK